MTCHGMGWDCPAKGADERDGLGWTTAVGVTEVSQALGSGTAIVIGCWCSRVMLPDGK